MYYYLILFLFCRRKTSLDRHRQQGYLGDVVSLFRLDEFKTFFCVSRVSVESLIGYIADVCNEKDITGILVRRSSGGSPQIPLEDRVLMMLWFMASLDKYSALADIFGVSESTASSAIRNLLKFTQEQLVDRVITWPSNDELQEIQDMYEELKNFPGVVGMIDGSHIKIKRPSVRGIDYYNCNNQYSVVLQAVVREDMRFIDVFTGYPGKVYDARVFRESPLYQTGQERCGNGHILGDSAYPNISWLLTPFRDNGRLTEAQKRYNNVHAAIRSTVERAFGLLKGRFTRLQRIDQRNIETIVQTVLTACVLHNICIMNNDDFENLLIEDQVPMDPNIVNMLDQDQEAAARKRLDIARRL
ncbi:LOW QUALITY PROTEIN: uncharacterized protein LOC123548132 [Mercenaria mercenaria]|uniref:LOW QUALITY PROTEIN: uncharacterized protein LOC123548132 n=1 Tax=Mercenaria mercenaria TaxID=6596 RepID=UPI00234E8294|nr:LOW QUALITY PROTEIN: uncharacterized protein LOC123548132 [Mercenaria mercenaria]